MSLPVVHSAHAEADVTLVTTAETVVLTIPQVTTRDRSELVTLMAFAVVTLGVGATALTMRIRRGTDITGTLVGEGNPVTGAAGNTVGLALGGVDSPGDVSGQSYVVTVQQTAATANGTALASAGSAIVGG